MRIRGFMTVKNLLLMTLAITSVSSIASLVKTLGDNTSEGNIFGPNESLEIALVSGNDELQLKVTGKKYYGSCPELKEDVQRYGKESFFREILTLHTTPGKCNFEETRQLFLNNVLTESLTDGTPVFYNSNILGRYYRKDYFNK